MRKLAVFLIFIFITQALFSQDVQSSDKGFIVINDADYVIQIGLVDNYKEVIDEWDDPDPEKVPGISSKNTFKIGQTVVPFIAFAVVNKNKSENDLFYNIHLVIPSGDISKNRMEKLTIKANRVTEKLFYRSNQLYGWTFDDKDAKGVYKVIIEIFDTETYKKTIELKFTLE